MNETMSNQIGGLARTLVPMILTMLATLGLLDRATADTLTAPIITAVVAIGTITATAAGVWSIYVNRPAAVIASAAAIDPKDVKIVVGPGASPDLKAVAADPAVSNVVSGSV